MPGDTRHRVDWSLWDRFLGTEPDQQLARRIGCSTRAVGQRRTALHVPMWGKRVRPNWAKWGALAGQVSDRRLEEESGISSSAIAEYRERHGIPPCDRRNTDPVIADLRVTRHKLAHPEMFGEA